jgi:hypothetical protein
MEMFLAQLTQAEARTRASCLRSRREPCRQRERDIEIGGKVTILRCGSDEAWNLADLWATSRQSEVNIRVSLVIWSASASIPDFEEDGTDLRLLPENQPPGPSVVKGRAGCIPGYKPAGPMRVIECETGLGGTAGFRRDVALFWQLFVVPSRISSSISAVSGLPWFALFALS